MVRLPVMTTPSTRMEVTLVAPCRNRLATEPVRNLRLLTTSSRVLDGLRWRLLVRAHAFMRANSSATVEMLLEPTRRYVSSAYFIRQLRAERGWRSEAATTYMYDRGPITQPRII